MSIVSDPAGIGAMGWAVEIPADGLDYFDLVCGSCGLVERKLAKFMGCRVRALAEARRSGWTFPRHHGDRQCPSCAIGELLIARGLWSPSGRPVLEPVPILRQLPDAIEVAIEAAAPFLAAEPVRRTRVRPASSQFDLFG